MAALRATGLATECRFTNNHRVFNRATWSTLQGSRILLGWLSPCGPAGHASVNLVVDGDARWAVQVTVEEVRAHSGFETYPQWTAWTGALRWDRVESVDIPREEGLRKAWESGGARFSPPVRG